MDFFATRLDGSKRRSLPTKGRAESDRSTMTEGENCKKRVGEGSFYGAQDHRMRRGGLLVVSSGIVALIALLLTPSFDEFPSQDFMLRVGDFVTKKTRVPWGQISVIAAVGFTAIAAFLFWAAFEHWKVRGNYIRAGCCFALGLGILIEGIFQWQ